MIRPIPGRSIGRTVFAPSKVIGKDNFFCLRTEFKTNLNGAEFSINGFPYSSQDIEAATCAHTCLWTVCRYLSQRYSAYKEMLPSELISYSLDVHGRKMPYQGLN
ncbi:hypothetical protein [Sedimentisphaera cyanobacteriorum]|uniref:hypothetical protein n=1 Tax=Sedimentisphaera cyanobacteriorum TaxID=1940790 RepID=UPI0009852C24|nr:hypothetical protein [Sedimentisphaera cyanobacteriorum]